MVSDVRTEKEQLLEELAKLEHDQWREWAETILERIKFERPSECSDDADIIAYSLEARWKPCFVNYDQLSEEQKEQDRVYARRVGEVLALRLRETANCIPCNGYNPDKRCPEYRKGLLCNGCTAKERLFALAVELEGKEAKNP